MDFSLILPTLGDQKRVKKFLDSIERNTKKKDEVEVLFAIDIGRTDIADFVKNEGYSFEIRFYERPVTENFSDDYYNWLAARTTGDNIWACNDDIQIETRHWDEKIRKKIKKFGWSVYLVDTKDTTRGAVNKGFCCFPIISRKAVNALGFFFYPQVRVYPADKIIYEVFLNAARIIDAQDIIINSKYVSEDKNPRLWKIFQEDMKSGVMHVNITGGIVQILLAGKNDAGPQQGSKLERIIKIIKE